ncbi:MAG: glycosyltransferase family 4 protein [Armatimonadota bacterium]|nr:glycosyltransferase family 4 protein [Armatimonadota bacterium]
MKILHLCPLWFPMSQDAPGGRETFLTRLIVELKKLGVENTLLASGDSCTTAEVWPVVPHSIGLQMADGAVWEYDYYEQHQLYLALQHAAEFDLIHSHIGHGAYLLSGALEGKTPVLHTLHTPVYRDLAWFVRQHTNMWFSTVSESQARQLWEQGLTRCQTIPNGIEVTDFTFQPQSQEGLIFLGRMEWGKGPDIAIQVARTLGRPLILAGPIVEKDFFASAIEPCLDDQIQYVGVVDHRRKNELLGQAGCIILPVRHAESFGLVSIEAMACGTPVVALANGALPEIIEPGLSGYLTPDEAALAPLVIQALQLDRSAIRARVAMRFSIAVVAKKYRQLYERIIALPY